ncbi:hypothetical protein N0V88_003515 [Collariella sp. IMI 366227]|nr:hypothetical protein N0V88_003515 [Collariella sp. IMI 366227]
MDKDELDDKSVATKSMTDLVPELSRGMGSERGSVPYPSFSKAHSKEFLHSKEDVSATTPRRTDPLTPETTDFGGSEMRRSKSADSPPAASVTARDRSGSAEKEAGDSKFDKGSRSTRHKAIFERLVGLKVYLQARVQIQTFESIEPSDFCVAAIGFEKNHYATSDASTPHPLSAFTSAPPLLGLHLRRHHRHHLHSTSKKCHAWTISSKTVVCHSPSLGSSCPPCLDRTARPSNPPLQGAETIFAPFFNLLNQYQTVLTGQGSIAVATGHRTVARRLLDRLENVFSRDLSPEGCPCIMCEHAGEPHRGLGWGEVLERVSGRIDLPPWPPFDFSVLGTKAVEDLTDGPPRPSSPVKMDPDIAEEFREHYLRQTKRVRAAVDKWMTTCEKTAAPPPQDVDDETLAFAILTNLEQEDRPYFNAVLMGSRELQSAMRSPTPIRKPRNDFIVKTGLSLQRLYRLHQAPRDAETAVYLVKYASTHDLLYTISDISISEWEILTSGRFDGFLWSGAEDDGIPFGEGPSRLATPASGMFPSPSRIMSPGGRMSSMSMSRNTTPFGPYSRGPTPASFISGVSGASTSSTYPARMAVSHDEEAEVAALAELEREIFNGMEALEDAFEKLHDRAMSVRDSLRRRGAALQMSLQQRRGGMGGRGIDVLRCLGLADAMIVPLSSNRLRRPKRRRERATPAPIEEEDEQ